MKNLTNRQYIWEHTFSELIGSDDTLIAELAKQSKIMTVKAKQRILFPGASCTDYLLMAEGRLRVQFMTQSGREVLLYHVNPGDDCVLTTSCLFSGDNFPVEGITETDITAIAIPAKIFHQTLEGSITFRKFVFSTFSKRLTDVIARMEFMCSSSIDCQLAQALLQLGEKNKHIAITHQELASEIGTVREVVSRHLKKFELNHWVQLGRGSIKLTNLNGLKELIV